jgi:hypothetical protein
MEDRRGCTKIGSCLDGIGLTQKKFSKTPMFLNHDEQNWLEAGKGCNVSPLFRAARRLRVANQGAGEALGICGCLFDQGVGHSATSSIDS